MHYYPHHIGDYRRDTSSLSILEHGAYRLLMDEYYATERPLPSDPAALCRICRAMSPAERGAVAAVVRAFFTREDDGLLHQKRISAEVEQYRAQVQTASRAGKASALSRERRRNARSTPVDSPLQHNGSAPPNGAATNQEPGTGNHLERESQHMRPALGHARAVSGQIGVTEQEAEDWWHAREASDWMKGTGGGGTTPVGVNWQADMRSFTNAMREQKRREDARERTRAGRTSEPGQRRTMQL